MMTDRELIELAAKAMGYKGVRAERGRGLVAFGHPGRADMLFHPLTSDALCFRLQVRLSITVVIADSFVRAEFGDICASEPFLNQKYHATRRAITRAAAEIGKAMEAGK